MPRQHDCRAMCDHIRTIWEQNDKRIFLKGNICSQVLGLIVNKSESVQVIAWSWTGGKSSHKQCWPSFVASFGLTGPQWVKVEGYMVRNIFHIAKNMPREVHFKGAFIKKYELFLVAPEIVNSATFGPASDGKIVVRKIKPLWCHEMKRSSLYRPFVRGILRWQKASNVDLCWFFAVSPSQLLNKHSSGQWSETPWRTRDITVMTTTKIPITYMTVTFSEGKVLAQIRWIMVKCFHTKNNPWKMKWNIKPADKIPDFCWKYNVYSLTRRWLNDWLQRGWLID